MNISEYATMADRERNYWWHAGRISIIDAWLKKWVAPPENARILNVGCGTGGTLPYLEKHGTVDNVDVSDEAIKFMRKSGYKVKKVNDYKLPYADNSYDVVVAFDVLEHIKEHDKALQEWLRVLKKDGKILFTVPAYQWLWSDHDTSLHHHRRYTRKLISDILPDTGKIERSSYSIVFSLPLIVGFRTMNKLLRRTTNSETSYVNVPKFINTFFTKLLQAEAFAHRYARFPLGTSVITSIGKK